MELSLTFVLVAPLVRQLGELDVDRGLDAVHAGCGRQLARPLQRRLDLLACG